MVVRLAGRHRRTVMAKIIEEGDPGKPGVRCVNPHTDGVATVPAVCLVPAAMNAVLVSPTERLSALH